MATRGVPGSGTGMAWEGPTMASARAAAAAGLAAEVRAVLDAAATAAGTSRRVRRDLTDIAGPRTSAMLAELAGRDPAFAKVHARVRDTGLSSRWLASVRREMGVGKDEDATALVLDARARDDVLHAMADEACTGRWDLDWTFDCEAALVGVGPDDGRTAGELMDRVAAEGRLVVELPSGRTEA